jgi:hypothetical protein
MLTLDADADADADADGFRHRIRMFRLMQPDNYTRKTTTDTLKSMLDNTYCTVLSSVSAFELQIQWIFIRRVSAL